MLLVVIVGVVLHQDRELLAVHPARRGRPRWRRRHGTVVVLADDRCREAATTAGTACSPARRSCSSRSSASTSSPPPRRRPRTRSATCRAASSPRWRSSPCSTCAVAVVLSGMVQLHRAARRGGAAQPGDGVRRQRHGLGREAHLDRCAGRADHGRHRPGARPDPGACSRCAATGCCRAHWPRPARIGTPVRITVARRCARRHRGAVFPIGKLEEMVNIGTLFAFVLVSAGVIVLRRTRPDLERGFRARACRCCRSRRSWPACG